MKFIIILTFSIIYFVVSVSAQEFKGPLEGVLKDELNLTLEQLWKKCEAKSKSATTNLLKNRSLASKIGNAVANDIVHRVRHRPRNNEHTWNQVVRKRCRSDAAIRVLSFSSLDAVNDCLDDNQKLKDHKKKDFEEKIFSGYCDAIKKLAKEKYRSGQQK